MEQLTLDFDTNKGLQIAPKAQDQEEQDYYPMTEGQKALALVMDGLNKYLFK